MYEKEQQCVAKDKSASDFIRFINSFKDEVYSLRDLKDGIQYNVRGISNKLVPREKEPTKPSLDCENPTHMETMWNLLDQLVGIRMEYNDIQRQLSEIV